MPRFYFHICNGDGFTVDEEGRELIDLAAARQAAITGARDLMSTEIRDGHLNPASFIEVEDDQHQLLFTLAFSEAFEIRTPGKGC